MISVGSRDGRKGLSLRYGVEGGEMDLETELEEGEACFQNNNDDDSTIDPDVALSYIDEKIQDVLGHFQKDFEGGVSAENLGAKFGGYGSFLPTYQRSPACPHPKTPPKVLAYNTSVSPNNLHVEGAPQNPASVSSASQPTRHGPRSISGAPAPAHRGPPVKQETHPSSARSGDKFTSNGLRPINPCDQKSLKVRIKVGSDNLSTRKKAEIYSGLGLDDSPSSSLEASPVDSDDFCHVPRDSLPYESPTSILEMMTSFPVLGGLLLSPLPYDLLYLTENEKWEDGSCGPVHKGSQESSVTVNRFDSSKTDQTKPKSSEDNMISMEPANANNVRNGIGTLTKKDADVDNMSCEELVSNALKLPLVSNTNVTDFKKGGAYKSGSSVVPKEESSDPVPSRNDIWVEKPYKKEGPAGNANSDEKYPVFPSESDVSKSSKVLDTGLVKAPKQRATSREKESTKSASKKKSKGNLENGFQSVEASKVILKNDSSSTSKTKNNIYGDLKNNNGKVRETYKDFFGELDPELEDGDDVVLEEKLFGDKMKDNRITEKGMLESNILSKERLNGKKGQSQKPSSSIYPRVGPLMAPATGTGPVPDAGSAPVAAVVNDDWVCCDKCEQWRLLPPGVNPGSLPEKWLCSMLDWLPGMNRCSISQEETTKAITSHFYVPAPMVQGLQPVHPGGPITLDALHPDQRHQPFGPQISAKKKPATKDPPNEPRQDRPSLSSNSTKKNLHTSNKSRSLNGTNQSNEVEFQDSGQSSSLIAEKHRLKQKEKKKSRENFIDEGNNANQMKIGNKRETSQDYSRDSKKVKIDGNHGTDEERAINSSASDLPAGVSRKDRWKHNDRSEDPKSGQKNKNGILQTGKFEDGDFSKKRKSNEFEDHETYVEATSETGQRKGKKPRVPEPLEEDMFSGKGGAGAAGKGGNIVDSSKGGTGASGVPIAATSSSSKVSGSHKTKANNLEAKGSPVESVSSSPLRISNLDKFTSSTRNVDDVASPKRKWEDAHLLGNNNIKADIIGHNEERRNENQSHANGSRVRKNGKGSSSRSKDKIRSSDKINLKITERTNENKSQEKPSVNSDKFEKGSVSKKESTGKTLSESAKQDVKERDGERLLKKDVSGRGKSHSLPPSGRGQNETARVLPTFPGSQKENGGNSLLVDAVEAPKQKKKAENLNGNQPNKHNGRDHGTPSRESSSQAASSAIKEAKAVKHMADRLKNSGSNHESKALYFQAALKFLYGASLLESCSSESGKHGDMIQSMGMYSSTAKLCEYVAHEYEKSKEMAAAALAHKLTEVAYLKVVYSSHTSASKDRQELQKSLHIGPTGESPSSSASDIDNLNNPAAIDKTALTKGVNSPQVDGNHIIVARNKPNFMRILNFAQDVNLAMEASRRSQIAFTGSGSKPEETHHKEVIKPALDYNFQDVEGLLHLVRVAMEVISR